jgi:hypothetical protein
MDEITMIEVPVEPDTARALTDAHRRAAVGRLIDRIVRPTRSHDPLNAILEATSNEAHAAGLTDMEIDAELAAYNAERRQD